jgi:hypothetical protein
MTTTADKSQVPLDSITHISAVLARLVHAVPGADIEWFRRAVLAGGVGPITIDLAVASRTARSRC